MIDNKKTGCSAESVKITYQDLLEFLDSVAPCYARELRRVEEQFAEKREAWLQRNTEDKTFVSNFCYGYLFRSGVLDAVTFTDALNGLFCWELDDGFLNPGYKRAPDFDDGGARAPYLFWGRVVGDRVLLAWERKHKMSEWKSWSTRGPRLRSDWKMTPEPSVWAQTNLVT